MSITVTALMQPPQYNLRGPAAQDKSITHAAVAPSNIEQPWRSHCNAICTHAELRNTIELRATTSELAAQKPDISTPEPKKNDFEALFKIVFTRKVTSSKMAKICRQIPIAAFMQPLQCKVSCSGFPPNTSPSQPSWSPLSQHSLFWV